MASGKRTETLKERHERELRAAFDLADKDGSGSIDRAELGRVLQALGMHPDAVELAELMERMDADHNGEIEFGEFADAVLGQEADKDAEQQLLEVEEVFNLFDTDGSGTLSASEVQRALRILGVSLSTEETQLLISEIDLNGDGVISCDELLQFVLSVDENEGEEPGGAGSSRPGLARLSKAGQGVRSGAPTDPPLRLPPPSDG